MGLTGITPFEVDVMHQGEGYGGVKLSSLSRGQSMPTPTNLAISPQFWGDCGTEFRCCGLYGIWNKENSYACKYNSIYCLFEGFTKNLVVKKVILKKSKKTMRLILYQKAGRENALIPRLPRAFGNSMATKRK